MSFRRDHDTELAWRKWVRAHEDELVAIGIPREVFIDRMTWWRFLEHALHPPASSARDVRFRLEDLSPDQQLRFYQFLDVVLPEQRGGNLVWTLLDRQFGTRVEDNTD